MKCRDIEPLLLAERDGVLTTEQHTALARHVAACPACRQFRANLTEAALYLKTDAANVAVPDTTQAWRDLRGQLSGEKNHPGKKRPLAPVIWFAAPLAAAAAFAFAYLGPRPQPTAPLASAPAPRAEIVNNDNLGADDSNVSTMAYVDQESGWLVVWATTPDAQNHG